MDANEMMMEADPASKTEHNFNMDNVQNNNFTIKATHLHFSFPVESSYVTQQTDK
jgi:hypothetical protein